MKKFLLAVLFAFNISVFGQSPITLTRADFPKPTASSSMPDSVLFTNVNGTSVTAHTLSGANTLWIESQLTGSTAYEKFLDMGSTPFVFQLLFFGSDYAQPLLNGNGLLSAGTVNDAYMYYNYAGNDSRLEIKGFGANVSFNGSIPAPLPALYTSPDVLYRFPITYGNTDSSESGYDISLPLDSTITIGFKRNQKRVNEVDAWGSLTIPAGTFDVLRLTSYITRVDSVSTPFGTIGFPSKPVEYKWLGREKKIPLLQVNGNRNGTNTTVTGITCWGEAFPSGLSQTDAVENMVMYPNPSSENVTVELNTSSADEIHIEIRNLNGAMVSQFHFKSHGNLFHETLPTSLLKSGQYWISVHCGNECHVQNWIKY